MKRLFYLLFLLALASCDKEDVKASLESHTVGKWVVYENSDTENTNPLAGFDFQSDFILYVYDSGNFNSDRKDKYQWSVKNNSEIVIVLLQADPNMQGNPVMFPNATQDDPIMIPVNIWNQGDPIMAVKIYGEEYKLVKYN